MSTSGRYQSRLFSFFSQQSLRLKDKTGQAWRQVKLAAVWSTQIALYPIYALFQTGRLLGRQMGQATRQVFPRLRAVKQKILSPSELNPSALSFVEPFALFSDTPIQNLLAETRGESPTLPIQGFASLLTNRALVLVTVENEILNVLTAEQQIQLQRQIVWEIATYWQYRKIQLLEGGTQGQGWNDTFLPLPKERANLLPPIRAFRHLMAWIQLSPVAIAVNLFQESRLAVVPATPDISSVDISSPADPLRSAQLPGSRVDLVQDLLNNRSSEPLSLLAWIKRQAKSLSGLLQNSSIILYDPLPKGESEVFSPMSQPLPQTSPQPWLKPGDFFNGEFLGVTGSRHIVKHGEAVQGIGAREAIADGHLEKIAPFDLANKLTKRSSSTSAINQPARNEQGIASTLLEAEVTEISYEQHPLEKLLKWLDQGMLWIEQKLRQAWRWLRRSGI